MTRPLSNDLRERVVAATLAGESCRAVAARFGVAVSSVQMPCRSGSPHGVFNAAAGAAPSAEAIGASITTTSTDAIIDASINFRSRIRTACLLLSNAGQRTWFPTTSKEHNCKAVSLSSKDQLTVQRIDS